MITHRLEVALRASRVLVIDRARVVDSGTPIELISRPGEFADLFGAVVSA